jgi:hypothetical protein
LLLLADGGDQVGDRAAVELGGLTEDDRRDRLDAGGGNPGGGGWGVLQLGEADPGEQLVSGLAAQRLGGGAVVQLGCVDPLEAQPHAAVGGGVDAVGMLELGVGVGVVGDEADSVAVGLLADDHQPAVDGQVVGCRHDASSRARRGLRWSTP